MNEIERAIEIVKKWHEYITSEWGDGEDFNNDRDHLLSLLRSELARQDAKPLTCDGCDWQPKMIGITRCQRCLRFPLLTDRYEPKGEKE